MNERSTLSTIALSLFLVACSESDANDSWAISVDTLPNGAVHVVNQPAPVEPGPTWTLQEELRIGTVDEAGPTSFGQIKGIAVAQDGRIAVLDAHAQEIRVFDASGRHLVTHGREGQGPGEFAGAWGLMLGPEGNLWVPDHANARMSVVDFEKGFITSFPMQVRSYGWVWGGAMMGDGRILEPSTTVGANRSGILRVYDTRMSQVDSLPLPTSPPSDPKKPPGVFLWESASGKSSGFVTIPFYSSARRLIDASGNVWSPAGDGTYRLKRWRPGGDTTLIVETRRPPVAVTAVERDSAIDDVRKFLREQGATDADWSRIPPTKAAIARVFPGNDGQMWVETSSADSLRRFDIYQPDGRIVGTAVSTLRLMQWVQPVVRDDSFWAVVNDDMGVSYVVRARILSEAKSPRP